MKHGFSPATRSPGQFVILPDWLTCLFTAALLCAVFLNEIIIYA
uniref:Uncharacterized protein n=1 Tax=Arundo donax TaxID=35708 RepID=A0A0A9B6X8_ARUDO